jgi:hypothetical protein
LVIYDPYQRHRRKIAGVVVTGDNCLPVSLILAKNLSAVSLSPAIIVTGDHCHRRSLFTGVVDAGKKFIICVVGTGNNFSAVSTTPVINLLRHRRSKKISDKD